MKDGIFFIFLVPVDHVEAAGQNLTGRGVVAVVPDLLPTACRLERPSGRARHVGADGPRALRQLELRADQRCRLRRLLGARLLLLAHARHALLLLAHLPSRRRDDQGHQPGIPHHQGTVPNPPHTATLASPTGGSRPTTPRTRPALSEGYRVIGQQKRAFLPCNLRHFFAVSNENLEAPPTMRLSVPAFSRP